MSVQIREERAPWGDGGCKDVRDDTADSVVVMTAGSRAGASHPPCRARSFSVVISLKLLLVFLELEITRWHLGVVSRLKLNAVPMADRTRALQEVNFLIPRTRDDVT